MIKNSRPSHKQWVPTHAGGKLAPYGARIGAASFLRGPFITEYVELDNICDRPAMNIVSLISEDQRAMRSDEAPHCPNRLMRP